MVVLAVLVALVVAAWRRPRWTSGLALAAPAVFLLGNRIFSPQFLLPLAAVWAAGLAMTPPPRRPPAALVVVLLGVAVTANWAVWPRGAASWVPLQWLLFAAAGTLTVLAVRAATAPPALGRCATRWSIDHPASQPSLDGTSSTSRPTPPTTR